MLEELNKLDPERAQEELLRCCGSKCWVEAMLTRRPFLDAATLYNIADEIWFGLKRNDWLEAFSHHPKIGDIESLKKKFASTSAWASGEQSGVKSASEETLKELALKNEAYEAKFGYIFIVCATGKSAGEMLALLRERIKNTPETEINIAAKEQSKITRLRLEKLIQ